MRAMRATVVLLVLVILSVAPSSARADVSPSYGYCAQSLRGETGQAPDNDIKDLWEVLEREPGVDVVKSYPVRDYLVRSNDHHGHLLWRFVYYHYGSGPRALAHDMHCYVDWSHYPSLRSYHDGWRSH